MNERILGLVAATHTPFFANGGLNLNVVSRQAQHLCDRGLVGVFVGGSTGEAFSLTLDERRELIARWTDVAGATPLRVIAHVSSNCLQDACALAAHAHQQGAHAISILPPFYQRPATVEALVEFCATVAAAAPAVPFYFYHIPLFTHVRPAMREFLLRAAERIPTFAGLKYTDQDLIQMQECLQLDDGRFEILNGTDEILLAAFSLGAQGAVGSTYNFAALLHREIIALFHQGDLTSAQSLQHRSVQLVRLLSRFGFAAAAKSVMSMIGVDCGPVRPPLVNLSAAEQAQLRDELEQAGYFEAWLR